MEAAADATDRMQHPSRRRRARASSRRSVRLPRVLNAAAASCGAPVSAEDDWATTCELTVGHHGAHRHGEKSEQSVWRGRLAVLRG